MEKEFVPYELALKLKELDFDEPCLAYYIKKDLHIYSHIVEFDGINASKLDVRNSKITENHRNFYGIEVTAPLWQQAFDFMAFKHNIHGNVITTGKDKIYMSYEYREGYGGTKSNGGTYTDIYDCRIDLLEDMIQLWKNK